MDRELLQDSDGVKKSFWDGLGVQFEAKYIFDFKSGVPRGVTPLRTVTQWAHAPTSTPWASQNLSFTAFESWWRQVSF